MQLLLELTLNRKKAQHNSEIKKISSELEQVEKSRVELQSDFQTIEAKHGEAKTKLSAVVREKNEMEKELMSTRTALERLTGGDVSNARLVTFANNSSTSHSNPTFLQDYHRFCRNQIRAESEESRIVRYSK